MIRDRSNIPIAMTCVPRIRGDDPDSNGDGVADDDAFPAYAGMIQDFSERAGLGLGRSPHTRG